jgi:hypothetical protein
VYHLFCLRSAPACDWVIRGEFEERDSVELEMKGGSVGVESDRFCGILAWGLSLGFG